MPKTDLGAKKTSKSKPKLKKSKRRTKKSAKKTTKSRVKPYAGGVTFCTTIDRWKKTPARKTSEQW